MTLVGTLEEAVVEEAAVGATVVSVVAVVLPELIAWVEVGVVVVSSLDVPEDVPKPVLVPLPVEFEDPPVEEPPAFELLPVLELPDDVPVLVPELPPDVPSSSKRTELTRVVASNSVLPSSTRIAITSSAELPSSRSSLT